MSERNPCPYCKGFVEHQVLDGEDFGLVAHQCVMCARMMEQDFECSSLCAFDKYQRKMKDV